MNELDRLIEKHCISATDRREMQDAIASLLRTSVREARDAEAMECAKACWCMPEGLALASHQKDATGIRARAWNEALNAANEAIRARISRRAAEQKGTD